MRTRDTGKIVTRKQRKAEQKIIKLAKPPVITDPAIKWKMDEERDNRIARDKDLEQGRIIYEKWVKRFINKPKHPDELVASINELVVDLDKALTTDLKNYLIQDLLYPIMSRLHQSQILDRFTTKVLVSCDHDTMKNGMPSKCEWGGQAAFHNLVWSQGKAVFQCPECGATLKQASDMIPVDSPEVQDWLKENKPKDGK
jgi:hypothetical protein